MNALKSSKADRIRGFGPIAEPDDDAVVGVDALDDLARRGFAADERPRLLALCFQLRRAYHFIDRTLVGRSESMRRLRERLWNNVFTRDLTTYVRHLQPRMEDFSTFLLGETGTGKGTAASALGRSRTQTRAFAE